MLPHTPDVVTSRRLAAARPYPLVCRPALLRTRRRHTAPLDASRRAARFVAALGRVRVALAAAQTSLHRRCRLMLLHTPDVVTSRRLAATRLYRLVGRLASRRTRRRHTAPPDAAGWDARSLVSLLCAPAAWLADAEPDSPAAVLQCSFAASCTRR